MSNIDLIKTAGQTLRTIVIAYSGKDGGFSEREVEPYSFKGELLYAYDISANSIKAFKLEKIARVAITNNSYVPKWPVEL